MKVPVTGLMSLPQIIVIEANRCSAKVSSRFIVLRVGWLVNAKVVFLYEENAIDPKVIFYSKCRAKKYFGVDLALLMRAYLYSISLTSLATVAPLKPNFSSSTL